MTKLSRRSLMVILAAAGLLLSVQDAWAVFSLSVSPRRGGRDIRFEASAPGQLLRNEEVTLSVTNTEGVQYRILQTVYQPLTNEKGQTIPQGAWLMFSPSEPLGILRPKLETPVTAGQQQIFSSNTAGDTDSFVLVFNVRVPEDQPGGVYRSQMTFIAEPVNAQAGISQQVVNLEAIVDIRSTFSIRIAPEHGGSTLNLGRISEGKKEASGVLDFEINSTLGAKYRILQALVEPPVSQEGVTMDAESIRFTPAGAQQGSLQGAGGPVEMQEAPSLLYDSSDSGSSDRFQVRYNVTPPSTQKAGSYNGLLQFRIESASPFAAQQPINVPFKMDVEPIFYLDMEIDQNASTVQFGTFRDTDEAREKKVKLTVHSNLGKPYQVSQIVTSKLANEEGAVIPAENYTYYGESAQTGIVKVSSPTPVPQGESVVFISDAKGSPEAFIYNYSLKVPKNTKGGTYTSDLRFSLTAN